MGANTTRKPPRAAWRTSDWLVRVHGHMLETRQSMTIAGVIGLYGLPKEHPTEGAAHAFVRDACDLGGLFRRQVREVEGVTGRSEESVYTAVPAPPSWQGSYVSGPSIPCVSSVFQLGGGAR